MKKVFFKWDTSVFEGLSMYNISLKRGFFSRILQQKGIELVNGQGSIH